MKVIFVDSDDPLPVVDAEPQAAIQFPDENHIGSIWRCGRFDNAVA